MSNHFSLLTILLLLMAPLSAFNPSNLHCCGTLDFAVDLLYWQAREDGLNFGSKASAIVNEELTNHFKSEISHPHANWDYGISTTLSYQYCPCWDYTARWNHFHTNAKNKENLNKTREFLLPAWGSNEGVGDLTLPLTKLQANWRLQLDFVDFEIGHQFPISDCLSARFHCGLRAAWIEQKYFITEKASFFSEPDLLTDLKEIEIKSAFEGIGIRTGIDFNLELCQGFSLYSKAALGLLYGHFKNHIKELNQKALVDFTCSQIERNREHVTRLISDLSLGLSWSTCCFSGNTLTLYFEWEKHLILNQNHLIDFTNTAVNLRQPRTSRGDLALCGYRFGIQLYF